MAFTSIQKIRFDDVDGAGIVYYPQYFHLCHAAFELPPDAQRDLGFELTEPSPLPLIGGKKFPWKSLFLCIKLGGKKNKK